MITLAWDTSGGSQSAALLVDGQVKAEHFEASGASHSETLLPILDSLLKANALQLSQVDLYALTVGPGSFTGLRIGISTLKAFAQVFDRPVAAVSSLEALAFPSLKENRPTLPGGESLVVACLDARLGEVFVAAYGAGRPAEGLGEEALPLETFLSWLSAHPGDKELLGTGAQLHRERLEKITGVRIPSSGRAHCIAGSSVAWVGERMWREGRCLKARLVAPRYLRPSEAESRLRGQKAGKLA